MATNIGSKQPQPLCLLTVNSDLGLELRAKDREERYQHSEDLLVDLRALKKKLESGKSTILRGSVGAGHAPPAATKTSQRVQAHAEGLKPERSTVRSVAGLAAAPTVPAPRLRKWQAATAACALLGLAGWALHLWDSESTGHTTTSQVRSFTIRPPAHANVLYGSSVISPDGRRIAYAAGAPETQLWIQELDEDQPRLIEGTEDAGRLFWAPDSKTVGFAAGGAVRKISIDGLAPVTICPIPGSGTFFQASWSPDSESILFSAGVPSKLYRVRAGGGPELLFSEQDGELDQWFRAPSFLPNHGDKPRAIVGEGKNLGDYELYLLDLSSLERHSLGVHGFG